MASETEQDVRQYLESVDYPAGKEELVYALESTMPHRATSNGSWTYRESSAPIPRRSWRRWIVPDRCSVEALVPQGVESQMLGGLAGSSCSNEVLAQ